MEGNTVSVLEAAKLLGAGSDTVYRLVKAERLRAHRKTRAPQSPFMIDRTGLEAHDRARRPVKCKTAILLLSSP
jgi:hypothetical protein